MAGLLKGAVSSFYSGPFYGEVAREHKGIGMAYMFLLALVLTVQFLFLFWASGLYDHARDAIASLPEKAETLPAITVKDGKLSIDRPSPYSTALGAGPEANKLVIDTRYKLTSPEAVEKYMAAGRIAIFVTADNAFRYIHFEDQRSSDANDELEITDIRDVQPFSISRDDWRVFAARVNGWGMASIMSAAFVTILFGLFVYNFVASLLTAIALMAADTGVKANLDFAASLRLAAVLRIPVLLWSILPVFFGFLPIWGMPGMVLWALYVVFALWAVKLSNAAAAKG